MPRNGVVYQFVDNIICGHVGCKAGVHTSLRRGFERERSSPYWKNSGEHFHGIEHGAMNHGADFARVYVGLGRDQGALMRDVAELLQALMSGTGTIGGLLWCQTLVPAIIGTYLSH